MLISALFTIARTWKQPKCPSTEKWIKKMLYMYIYTHTHNGILHTMEYYTLIEKNEIMLFMAM